jgi:hypothetical protein
LPLRDVSPDRTEMVSMDEKDNAENCEGPVRRRLTIPLIPVARLLEVRLSGFGQPVGRRQEGDPERPATIGARRTSTFVLPRAAGAVTGSAAASDYQRRVFRPPALTCWATDCGSPPGDPARSKICCCLQRPPQAHTMASPITTMRRSSMRHLSMRAGPRADAAAAWQSAPRPSAATTRLPGAAHPTGRRPASTSARCAAKY